MTRVDSRKSIKPLKKTKKSKIRTHDLWLISFPDGYISALKIRDEGIDLVTVVP